MKVNHNTKQAAVKLPRTHNMNKVKIALSGLGLTALASLVNAAATPVDAAADITAAANTATTVFNGFATLSIAAFVLAMVFAFARKGKR